MDTTLNKVIIGEIDWKRFEILKKRTERVTHNLINLKTSRVHRRNSLINSINLHQIALEMEGKEHYFDYGGIKIYETLDTWKNKLEEADNFLRSEAIWKSRIMEI